MGLISVKELLADKTKFSEKSEIFTIL